MLGMRSKRGRSARRLAGAAVNFDPARIDACVALSRSGQSSDVPGLRICVFALGIRGYRVVCTSPHRRVFRSGNTRYKRPCGFPGTAGCSAGDVPERRLVVLCGRFGGRRSAEIGTTKGGVGTAARLGIVCAGGVFGCSGGLIEANRVGGPLRPGLGRSGKPRYVPRQVAGRLAARLATLVRNRIDGRLFRFGWAEALRMLQTRAGYRDRLAKVHFTCGSMGRRVVGIGGMHVVRVGFGETVGFPVTQRPGVGIARLGCESSRPG